MDSRREALWKSIEQSEYRSLPPLNAPLSSPISAAIVLLRILVDRAFCNNTVFKTFVDKDDIRPDRTKLFHPFGTVAKAQFVPVTNTTYDGIFQSGALCLVRLSLGSDTHNYVPGIAVKFFVKNKPSLNVVGVPCLDGQTSQDFFAREPKTSFLPATGSAKALEGALGCASKSRDINTRKVTVTTLGQVRSDGTEVPDGRAPDVLTFRNPSRHLAADTQDFRAGIGAVCQPGDVLYEVWGNDNKLGELKLETGFKASAFGDRELSFHHQRSPIPK